jgi:hypothetical protein
VEVPENIGLLKNEQLQKRPIVLLWSLKTILSGVAYADLYQTFPIFGIFACFFRHSRSWVDRAG